MASPVVDILIPCYNYGRYVEESVRSAVAQTYDNCRILVINDGSTDDSAEVLAGLAQDLPITVVNQSNQGLIPTLRRAIGETGGEFIVTLSADDRLLAQFVERTVERLQSEPAAGYCYTQMRLFGEREEIYQSRPFDARLLVCAGNFIGGGGALLRRSSYEATRGFQKLSALEDWDLWLSFLDAGFTGAFLPEPLYEWRQHRGSRNDVPRRPARRLKRQIQLRHVRLLARYLPGYLPTAMRNRFGNGLAHAVGADP